MFRRLVRTDERVTLLGAVPVSSQNIEDLLTHAPFLVAADGGAVQALNLDLVPEAVIGDFDSLPQSCRRRLQPESLYHVSEQDSTDFEKCLRAIEAPLILAAGFAGRRLDHELAVYNALVRHPQARCIVVGGHDLVFRAPREISLDLPHGTRLSLFPLGPVRGTSAGLRWPIDGLQLSPDGRVATSNTVTGPVRLTFSGDQMLVIMPREALAAVMPALDPPSGAALG